MKSMVHAVAGVLGFLLVTTFVTSTVGSLAVGGPQTVAFVKAMNLMGMFALLPALVGAGATGVSLLGTRTDSLAVEKQKRGPRAFMTSLLIVLPSAGFLWFRASAGTFDALFYGVQAIELAASGFALFMIGLNIRDGLALRGRISLGGPGPSIVERNGGPLVVTGIPALTSEGNDLKSGQVMALCRCGASATKPFCDGSHNRIGFDSTCF